LAKPVLQSLKNTLLGNCHREPVYRPFQFHERSQYFIGANNEPPSVAAVRVNNPDRSPARINR
jgi:hypothetical protein